MQSSLIFGGKKSEFLRIEMRVNEAATCPEGTVINEEMQIIVGCGKLRESGKFNQRYGRGEAVRIVLFLSFCMDLVIESIYLAAAGLQKRRMN